MKHRTLCLSLHPPHSASPSSVLNVTAKEPLARGISLWVPSTWNREHHDTLRRPSQQNLVMGYEL